MGTECRGLGVFMERTMKMLKEGALVWSQETTLPHVVLLVPPGLAHTPLRHLDIQLF